MTNTSFADTVRIVATEETERLGFARKTGSVRGHTTPSYTEVEVIGDDGSDAAINVFFDDLDEGFWFAPRLVEFVDHSAGAVISLECADHEHVKEADGSWTQVPKLKH